MVDWVVYCRVSDDDQVEGASLDAQEQSCRHYLLAKGISGITVVRDEGHSAWQAGHLNRPGLKRILAAAERHEIAGVVVWKLDRWCRRCMDLVRLIDDLGRWGCCFASVTESIDTSSAIGRFQLQLFGALAELESGRTSERISAAMRHIRAKGGVVGGRPPAGLSITGAKGDRKLVPQPQHAPAVAQCWARVLAGATLREVAAHLTTAGVPCHGKLTPWSVSSTQKLLANENYVGRLVTREDWEGAKQALAGRPCPLRGNQGQRAHQRRVWLLSGGIGRCGSCGGTLNGGSGTSHTGVTHYYYRCRGKAQLGAGHCEARDLPAEPWECAVVQTLQQAVRDGELAASLNLAATRSAETTAPLREEERGLQLEHDRLAAEVARLIDLAAAGQGVKEALAEGIGQRQHRIVELANQLAGVRGRLAAVVLSQQEMDARLAVLTAGLDRLTELPAADQALAIQLFVREARLFPDPKRRDWGDVDLTVELPDTPKNQEGEQNLAGSTPLTDLVEVRRLNRTTARLRRRVWLVLRRGGWAA